MKSSIPVQNKYQPLNKRKSRSAGEVPSAVQARQSTPLPPLAGRTLVGLVWVEWVRGVPPVAALRPDREFVTSALLLPVGCGRAGGPGG